MATDSQISDSTGDVEAPSAKPSNEWPKVGELNVLEASIGKKGMGKSTHQAARAWKLQEETGGYVIGHSLGARLPERLPKELGGASLPITYHQSIEALDRGLRRHPKRWHVLAPLLPEEGGPEEPDTADDLMRYSIRLSRAIREAAYRRAHPMGSLLGVKKDARFLGLRAPPVIVILDEGIAAGGAATGQAATGDTNRWFLSYIYSLRHYHVALFYAIQEPTSRSWRVLESATTTYVFRLDHEWAINAIRAAGASAEQAEQVRTLKPYQYITLR